MRDEILVIAQGQATLLASATQKAEAFKQQAEQAARERDIILLAICSGHGIEDVRGFTLTGLQLTVTVPVEGEDDAA